MPFSHSISQTSPGRSSFVCRTAACCRRRCKTEKWCPTISSWVKPCSRSIADFKAISTTWAAKAPKLIAVIAVTAWGKGPSDFEAMLNMAWRSISACRSQDAACCGSVLHRTPHCHEHAGEHIGEHTHTHAIVLYEMTWLSDSFVFVPEQVETSWIFIFWNKKNTQSAAKCWRVVASWSCPRLGAVTGRPSRPGSWKHNGTLAMRPAVAAQLPKQDLARWNDVKRYQYQGLFKVVHGQ